VTNDAKGNDMPGYLKPIVENINKNAAKLRQLSHDIHDEQLVDKSSKIEKLWTDAFAVCKLLKGDIDCARSLIFPGAFTPYTTQWDSVL